MYILKERTKVALVRSEMETRNNRKATVAAAWALAAMKQEQEQEQELMWRLKSKATK